MTNVHTQERIGIIGGTGFENLACILMDAEENQDTPYGLPSSPIRLARWQAPSGSKSTDAKHSVAFLSRHGFEHQIPPHRINYRANLSALKAVGCQRIIAIYAVGGIHEHMRTPGHVVIPDQIIDYTSSRTLSFWDDESSESMHVDFTEPYTPALFQQLVEAARSVEQTVSVGGTYAAVNGPRLETAAEIRRMARDGSDIVGMTGMPEAALARELGMDFAALCLVVNPAAGFSVEPITDEMVQSALAIGTQLIYNILSAFFSQRESSVNSPAF